MKTICIEVYKDNRKSVIQFDKVCELSKDVELFNKLIEVIGIIQSEKYTDLKVSVHCFEPCSDFPVKNEGL